jgi:hypothetical protein
VRRTIVEKVDRSHDVPYLAGSSNDNRTVYIDRRVPKTIKVGDKTIDPTKYLSVHEETEHALMHGRAMPYEIAHHHATQAEKAAVEADGVNWKEYERVLDGYIDETEHEKPKNPPKDLYVKPYPHKKALLLEKLAKRAKPG